MFQIVTLAASFCKRQGSILVHDKGWAVLPRYLEVFDGIRSRWTAVRREKIVASHEHGEFRIPIENTRRRDAFVGSFSC